MANLSRTAQERQWQAQDDLRTLQQAQNVMSDKKRLSAAQKEAAKQSAALAKVAGRKSPTPQHRKAR